MQHHNSVTNLLGLYCKFKTSLVDLRPNYAKCMSHNAMGENSIEYLQYSLRKFFKIFSIFAVNQAR